MVVLDLQLGSDISGLEVLNHMRRINPVLRAIILTGYPDYSTALEAGYLRALGYVPKLNVSSLTAKIRDILSAAPVRVFLSYNENDRDKVSEIFNKLVEHGFLPWMDVNSIEPGMEWEPAIKKAIGSVDKFVYCLSRHSVYKEGVMRKELKWALDRQEGLLEDSVFFIAARLEECEVVGGISRFQYVDLFKPAGFSKLLRALAAGKKIGK